MPQLELRALDIGARSTLYASADGRLYRRYHDTDRWDGPVAPYYDSQGVARLSGNRRLDTALAGLFDPGDTEAASYRGAHGTAATAAAAVAAANHRATTLDKAPPPYLRRALTCLLRGCDDVDGFARRCGVERSTAWGYVARCVELWPESSASLAVRFVYPPLVTALRQLSTHCGSLREVMERLQTEDTAVRGDPEWRCVAEPFAHLRLARLCVQAMDEGGRT